MSSCIISLKSSNHLQKAGVDVAHVKKTSGLWSLDPVLVDGLLRVGGRLDLALASFDSFD